MPKCNKCRGTGWYQYSKTGTPHFTVCPECCPHNKGWWLLSKHYVGYREGRETWCCRVGCGTTRDDNPEGLANDP